MNWHLSHLGSAVLFCVGFLFGLLCFGGFAFGWCLFFGLLFVFGGDFITAFWPVISSLLMASQSADGLVYALINPCSPICNMQLNVLNDLAEAMKALDGKKKCGRTGSGLIGNAGVTGRLWTLVLGCCVVFLRWRT